MRLPSGWLPFSLAAFTVDFTGWHQRRSACTDPSAAVAAIFPQLRQVFLHVRGGNLFVALVHQGTSSICTAPLFAASLRLKKHFFPLPQHPRGNALCKTFPSTSCSYVG